MSEVIIGLVIALLSVLFAISSRKKALIDAGGNKILKLSIGYGIVGIICLIVVLFVLAFDIYWIITSKPKTISTVVYVVQLFIFLFFGGAGIGLVLATWLAKITYNENSIVSKTFLGNIKTIRWIDIKSIKYRAWAKDLIISDGRVKIICEEHVKGFVDFTKFIEEKTGITREKMGLPKNVIR